MRKVLTGRVSVVLNVVLGLAMLTGFCCNARADAFASKPTEITVSASRSVSIMPDTVSVSFSLVSLDKTADQAQKTNSDAVKKVLEVLKEKGIDEKDICTTNYNIYTQYDYSDSGDSYITGYNVSTYMTVKNQKTDSIGEIMADCIAAGVNNIDSVVFTCSNYEEAYQQALLQAVKDSEEKAARMAEAVGKKLGETISVVEGGRDSLYRSIPTGNVALAMEKAEDDAGGPVLLPGEYEVMANVTVTYQME